MPFRVVMTKALRRVVKGDHYGPLVALVSPEGVYLKQEGRRKLLGPVTWPRLYLECAKIEADRIRAEREAARLERGGKPRKRRTRRRGGK